MPKPLPAVTAPLEDTDEPLPPRWQGLKRLFVGIGVLLFLLALLRLAWGWHVGRRLRAEIDLYRSRGQPIRPEDFLSPPIPDQDNAVVALLRAADWIPQTAEYRKLAREPYESPWSAEREVAWSAAVVAANRRTLEQMRAARSLTAARWPQDDAAQPHPLARLAELARILQAASFDARQRGDHAAAADYFRDLLFIGRVADQWPRLFAHLASLNMEGMAAGEIMVWDWRADAEGGAQRGQPAPPEMARLLAREQLTALVGELLEDALRQRQFVRALAGSQAEGMKEILLAEYPPDRLTGRAPQPLSRWQRAAGWWTWPSYELEATRSIRRAANALDAAKAADWARAEMLFPFVARASMPPRQPTSLYLVDRQLSEVEAALSDPLERTLRLGFWVRGMRHAAALALAIRMYQADHQGRLPARLDELVPAYLARVPADPFAPDGSPMRYGVAAGVPFVYSVYENGTDDIARGAAVPTPSHRIDWNQRDVVFFMRRPPAPPPPAAPASPTRHLPSTRPPDLPG